MIVEAFDADLKRMYLFLMKIIKYLLFECHKDRFQFFQFVVCHRFLGLSSVHRTPGLVLGQ